MPLFQVGFKHKECSGCYSATAIKDTKHFNISKGANYYWIHCNWCAIQYIINEESIDIDSKNLDDLLWKILVENCPPQILMDEWFNSLRQNFENGKQAKCDEINAILKNY